MDYLPPIVADFRLHLPYPFLQGHGGLHLQEADLGLPSGDLSLPSGGAELARCDLYPRHGMEEDHYVLDVSPHGPSAQSKKDLMSSKPAT